MAKENFMTDNRKFIRYRCKIKTNFQYYTGDPDKINIEVSVPCKGKGLILDISEGGLFFVTNERLTIESIINIFFAVKKNKFNLTGKVIRTGFIKNNPSKITKRFSMFSSKGKFYVAVQFDSPITNLIVEDL